MSYTRHLKSDRYDLRRPKDGSDYLDSLVAA